MLAAAGALAAGAAAAAGPQAVEVAAAGEESMEPVVVQLRGYRKVGCWEADVAGSSCWRASGKHLLVGCWERLLAGCRERLFAAAAGQLLL